MKTKIAVILSLALVIPTAAAEGKRAAPHRHAGFWGKLNPRLTGHWARAKVMRKGFLAGLVKRVAKKHGPYAELLKDALQKLNAKYGKCNGRWPNVRMALANLAAGAVRGAGAALAGPMKNALTAIGVACDKIGKGGQIDIVKALREGLQQLGKKVKPFFRRHVRIAIQWLRKPNLWAKQAKPVKKTEETPAPEAAKQPESK